MKELIQDMDYGYVPVEPYLKLKDKTPIKDNNAVRAPSKIKAWFKKRISRARAYGGAIKAVSNSITSEKDAAKAVKEKENNDGTAKREELTAIAKSLVASYGKQIQYAESNRTGDPASDILAAEQVIDNRISFAKVGRTYDKLANTKIFRGFKARNVRIDNPELAKTLLHLCEEYHIDSKDVGFDINKIGKMLDSQTIPTPQPIDSPAVVVPSVTQQNSEPVAETKDNTSTTPSAIKDEKDLKAIAEAFVKQQQAAKLAEQASMEHANNIINQQKVEISEQSDTIKQQAATIEDMKQKMNDYTKLQDRLKRLEDSIPEYERRMKEYQDFVDVIRGTVPSALNNEGSGIEVSHTR